ncbi:MAG: Rieske 2Fe-2S domain-containing protein [Candidatus Bathyarchaeia archaeon]
MPFVSRANISGGIFQTVRLMTPVDKGSGFQRRAITSRGQPYTNACLSCKDLANCCGSTASALPGTEFDGASPVKKKGLSRRDALKIMGGISAALALAPFTAAGSYLIPTVSTKFNPVLIAKKGDVPVNGSTVFWFPFTTDPTYTNMLIHLPPDLAAKAGQEFVAYNRTCIHLQCLVSYLSNSEIIGCPCHGSEYRPTDGWPVAGPAAQIGRYLPSVKLRIDGDNIYAESVDLDVIGYGSDTPPSQ